MPKRAVAIYFLLALVGAALFVYFTFPRTAAEIPRSNNQRPYPSSPGPNGVPVPDNVPRPAPPTPPHGPSLRVMAWGTAGEAAGLRAQADAFEAAGGERVSLLIDADETSYRRDLQEAFASGTPPDICLVSARDFSGLDPVRDLAPQTPAPGAAPRSVAAFAVGAKPRAVPDEFSVDLLFYNSRDFDRVGIACPGRHWTWDIMEAITRALASRNLKNDAGQTVYPLELPADFDFWNILCTQAGHPALDRDHWHLADADGRDSQLRGLDLIHEFFGDLNVTAPPGRIDAAPGRYFMQQRAALLIAPSELAASLPDFPHGMTLLPSDLSRASLARVNGWAVAAQSSQVRDAGALAQYLGARPLHTGWSPARLPRENGDPALCYEALEHSLLPRLEPKTARLAQLLDRQINSFAVNPEQTTSENLYDEIQAEYQSGYAPKAAGKGPNLNKADGPELRGL